MVFCNGRITFNRGDDDHILVVLKTGETFKSGDKVFFSVKALKEDTVDLLQIESTEFVPYLDPVTLVETADAAALITIPHESTIDLELGKYYYDILIQWADGDYKTVVPPTRFTLTAGGSHDGTP